MTFRFPDESTPAHEKYGYGRIDVGEGLSIDLSNQSDSAVKIRNGLGSYGQYYNKKFKTRVHGGFLHIMRIA